MKNRKIKKILKSTLHMLVIGMLFVSNLTAASASGFSMGMSKTSVEVGETITLTARIGDANGIIQIRPTVSGGLSIVSGVGSSGQTADVGLSSIKIKVTGPGSVSVSGFAIDTDENEYPANATYTITIKEPVKEVDSGEKNKQDLIVKTPAQIEAEKKAREERDKLSAEAAIKAEEERKAAELEERKVTPLFSEINIISNSEKMMGETLGTVESLKETFEYTYTLPKRIDAFTLDLKALEGATLTYDKDHTIPEGETSIVVPVKAIMDDISQEFKITVSKNTDKAVVVTVGEKDLEVYDDELFDAAMATLGFEKASFEQGEAQVPYFVKGAMSLALLQEGENVSWYALSDTQEFTDSGALYLDEENKALFILEADEEVSANRLYQNGYSEKTLDAREELVAVDSTLNFSQTYKSWKYDETREVVYGFDESGDKDFYVFGDKQIKAAVVAFDAVDKTYQMVSWGLGGVLFSLLGTGSLFALAQRKNGKKEDDVLEEDFIEA